jgi:ADP-heptose:LPS heptosyltransferase
MVDNFRNVVALLGADVSDKSTEVFPSENDEKSVDAVFASEGISSTDTLVALNPGASAPSNRWTPDRFAQLVDILSNHGSKDGSVKVIVLGAKSDLEAVSRIRELAHHDFIQLTGKLSVMELAVVLGRCRVVVTGDTGPMHIAVAMRSTVICLFGPAVPSESGPGYSPGNLTIRKVERCGNCTKYLCREDHKCMRLITAEEVYEEVRGILEADRIL